MTEFRVIACCIISYISEQIVFGTNMILGTNNFLETNTILGTNMILGI